MPSEDEPGTDPVADLADRLAATGYVADRALAMVLYLAQQLESPILLEGEPGVGKTSVAEALAEITGARLVRLQCYEGLAAHHALYEWDYTRQLLSIRLSEAGGADHGRAEVKHFQPRIPAAAGRCSMPSGPGTTAPWSCSLTRSTGPTRSSRRSCSSSCPSSRSRSRRSARSVPSAAPVIILTANRTRSLSDALRRRCLYHWIPFPGLDREIAILQARLPGASALLVQQTCLFVERIRAGYYRKAPGISETLDWLRALTLLGGGEISPARVAETIGVLLKDSEDIRLFREKDHERVYREYGLRATT